MMLFLQKCWLWLKKFWWVPLLIIGIVLLKFFGGSQKLIDLFNITIDSHRKEKEALEKLAKEEEAKKEQEKKKYDEVIKKIEEKYKKDNQELTEEKKERVKELVKDNTAEQLAEKLAKEFGIHLS